MRMNTFDESLRLYLQFLRLEKGLSDNTCHSYENDLRHYLRYIENTFSVAEPAGIDLRHIERYLEELMELGLETSTLARNISSIRSYHAFLISEGWAEANPAELVELPKLTRRLPEVLTVEEVERILDEPDTKTPVGLRDRAILECLYATGMRVSELVSLTRQQLVTELQLVRVLGKGSKERLIPIGKPALKAISEYLKSARSLFTSINKETDDKLFLNQRGGPLSRMGVYNIVRKSAKEAGIKKKVYPHIFRHSFATHLLEGGADLRDVQEMLGHVSIITTEIYTHVDRTLLQRTYDNFHPRA